MNKNKIMSSLNFVDVDLKDFIFLDEIIISNLPYENYICFIDDSRIGYFFTFNNEMILSFVYFDSFIHDFNSTSFLLEKTSLFGYGSFVTYLNNIKEKRLIEKSNNIFFKNFFDLNFFKLKKLFKYDEKSLVFDFYNHKKLIQENSNLKGSEV